MALFRKWMILIHRYLGIPLSVLFVVWFASGIVMMYAGEMPRLSPQLRLARLPALDLARVRLSPSEAVERAGLRQSPGRATLLTVMDRPAYRVGGATIFADTGEWLAGLALDDARRVASRFMDVPDDQVHHVGTLTRADQWTLTQDHQMPVHKFRVDDGAGTELYVSPRSAEVTVLTTRRSRMLAWIGTIPHWLYFAALRLNQRLWYRLIVWTANPWLRPRDRGADPGHHPVQADQAVPPLRLHSVLRLDAMALRGGRHLRRLHPHVGL